MGLGLDWDSPLGLADQFSLRANQDAVSDHWRHSDSQYLNYSVPWGWWTFTYSYNQSYYRTRDDSSGFPFKLDGDSQMHQLRVERVIHRDALSKTAVNLGISHLRTNNYLDDSLIDVSSTRLSESQLGVNHGRRIGTAFLNLDAGWQQGIGAFDAQGAGDPHGTEPVARYNKYSLTLSYLQPFTLWAKPSASTAWPPASAAKTRSTARSASAWAGSTRYAGSSSRPSPATAAATGATSCAGVAR